MSDTSYFSNLLNTDIHFNTQHYLTQHLVDSLQMKRTCKGWEQKRQNTMQKIQTTKYNTKRGNEIVFIL